MVTRKTSRLDIIHSNTLKALGCAVSSGSGDGDTSMFISVFIPIVVVGMDADADLGATRSVTNMDI